MKKIIFLLLALFFICFNTYASMTVTTGDAFENFLTYSVTDENSDFTISQNKVTWSSLRRDADSWVVLDKGAGYFSGDFTHDFEFMVTASSGTDGTNIYSVTNNTGDLQDQIDASGNGVYTYLTWNGSNVEFVTFEMHNGSLTWGDADTFALSYNTLYYARCVRTEGSPSTWTCDVYSDPGRTSEVCDSTVNLTDDENLRYLFPVLSRGAASDADEFSGYVQRLSIGE
jgi:hypothetical protein